MTAAGGVGLALGLGRLIWAAKSQVGSVAPQEPVPEPVGPDGPDGSEPELESDGTASSVIEETTSADPGWRPQAVEDPARRRPDGRIGDLSEPPVSELVKVQDIRLTKPAADGYRHMLAAARDAGIAAPLLNVVSGYRGLQKQDALWQRGLQKYRTRLTQSLGHTPTDAEVERETRKWVAPPGSSAHQTGRAVDLQLGTPIDSQRVAEGRSTPAYQWLAANAARFGFYPYAAEPWHWEFNPP